MSTDPTPEPGTDSGAEPGPDPRVAQLERENTLLRALGHEVVETPLGQMFSDAYKGPLESDAIKAAAKEVGLVVEPPPPAEPRGPGEAQQTDLRGDLGAPGGFTPPPEPEPTDPRVESRTIVEGRLQQGKPHVDAIAAGLGPLAAAALAGDKRVLVTDE